MLVLNCFKAMECLPHRQGSIPAHWHQAPVQLLPAPSHQQRVASLLPATVARNCGTRLSMTSQVAGTLLTVEAVLQHS